jgi:NADH-quinone oxidoreductase subunit G
MSEDRVTIEVDGRPLKARKGVMLIEVTDAADIYIPRFCYHKKLSIAANCRMCLVEVEKAPKPLPACATPVTEGMKVWTRSALAQDAQRSTMEFLLINHPLDCPICDQGGECELQDLAMGYGSDISRYAEKKRVVKDKNIGSLVQTDMTRCIHCTRCVRFGDEIAGLRELGATGRGEHMEIGTYIEKAMSSELSGNVIDLCPVGALTSKPFRYTARAWELRQHAGIAPHDSIGSNIYLHVQGNRIKRVVPRENEAINEVWIADRDRFSYEGLYSADRLTAPLIKVNGRWQEVDWDRALGFAIDGLKRVLGAQGPGQIGALASPQATVEELYLLQKFMRGLGSNHIDHRLRQLDFTDQDQAPLFPWLGQTLTDLERVDAALLIGSYVRKEQPIANHRLRKAALRGGRVMVVNPLDHDFNLPISDKLIVPASHMIWALAGIAKALLDRSPEGELAEPSMADLLKNVEEVNPAQRSIAENLKAATEGTVLLGNLASAHPAFGNLRALAGVIAKWSRSRLGYLTEAANSCGAWLAGALPHRGAGGKPSASIGLHAQAMLNPGLKAYLLLGIEPEFDCASPAQALRALRQAEWVVSLSAYRTSLMEDYADVLLPIALFAENGGHFVNAVGERQSFKAAVSPLGEARPAWKILRVLGNHFDLEGFEYVAVEEVATEVSALIAKTAPDNQDKWLMPTRLERAAQDSLQLVCEVPIYSLDPLVRRASALQQTLESAAGGALHINQALADALGLSAGDTAALGQNGSTIQLPLQIDARVPVGCVWLQGAHAALGLECGFGPVTLGMLNG